MKSKQTKKASGAKSLTAAFKADKAQASSVVPLTTNLSDGGKQIVDEDQLLSTVLSKIDTSDKESLSKSVGELLALRIHNERLISTGIGVGVLGEHITVEDAAMLLSRSKDSVSDLVKVKRLMDGQTDGSSLVITDEKTFARMMADISARYRGRLSGGNSDGGRK